MPPTLPPDDDRAARRRAGLILLAITSAGGLLRFAFLGRPCLWGDEALVYWRTCGSYADLLQPLHSDGFPPLHYELFWLIVHTLGHAPGPAAMRSVAATCGTLMVPAVYCLARQLLPRRTSLVAAAVTAGSAFALFYSRDAKMYAEAWLAMTASVACLLGWLRTGRSTAWLGWVAAGAAAGGLQTTTLLGVLGMSPLFLLTQRNAHWRQSVLWLAGVVLIAAGPVGYYARFNVWTENVDGGGWRDSGLAWVAAYNHGRTGPQQVRYLATTFLTGWEWPRTALPRPVSAPTAGGVAWSTPFVGMPLARSWGLTLMAIAVLAVLAAGLLPWPRAWIGRPPVDLAPEPPWRAALWLAAWIVLPVYGFYCRSVPDFAAPADALGPLGMATHPRVWIGVSAFAITTLTVALGYRPTRPAAVRCVQLATAFAGIVAACQAMAMLIAPLARAATAAGHPWQSVWVPRYLGFAWPAVAIATAVLLDRLPTAPVRAMAISLLLAANLGMFAFRLFGSTEPPVDRMAADVWAAQPQANAARPDALTWTDLDDHSFSQTGPGGGNLFSDVGRYYLQLLARRPMSPALFKRSLGTFRIRRGDAQDELPAAVATARPSRVVVWEQSHATETPAADDLLRRSAGWRGSSDQPYVIHDVWTAQDLTRFRRREYLRGPTTQP